MSLFVVQDRAMCDAEIRNVSHMNLLRNRVYFFFCVKINS